MSSKKSDKLKLKDIKEINTILCEYFASYCIHGKSVTGIPLNSGTRVYSTINVPMFCPIDRVLYASELT